MPPKPIVHSDHARQRLKARGLTRQHIHWLIARGTRRRAPTRGGAQRWAFRGAPVGKREAEVIVIEGATQLFIITAYWLD